MKIALLGTGLMGGAIAQRLSNRNYSLFLYNRTISKANSLKSKKTCIVSSPKEAIERATCIIFTLSDARVINNILSKLSTHIFKAKTFIQIGTIGPQESIDLNRMIVRRGGYYFECPVLGSKREALDGNLILMFAGEKKLFAQWKDFLKVLGTQLHYIGPVGKAATVKLALNQLIASHAFAFSLSLALLQKAKINVDDFMAILRKSALYAPMFDKKLAKWLSRDYSNPNFPAKHLLKDVNLIIKEAQQYKITTNVLGQYRNLLQEIIQKKMGDLDYSALFEVIKK